ncbi:hypothetical protein CDD80_5812 [Ophiocordyceps camponoti-rufipedis]|uniref:Uncharacterized protein n=1 Tax=Ophiocordyceps camponoti-rufipedis TaxID=2004952 RepID=A0A2C5ZM83_9HYPO|nr:hypothetical protein CDD80_5812 [Ophiocordyceps camponoti-rufipedis]
MHQTTVIALIAIGLSPLALASPVPGKGFSMDPWAPETHNEARRILKQGWAQRQREEARQREKQLKEEERRKKELKDYRFMSAQSLRGHDREEYGRMLQEHKDRHFKGEQGPSKFPEGKRNEVLWQKASKVAAAYNPNLRHPDNDRSQPGTSKNQ